MQGCKLIKTPRAMNFKESEKQLCQSLVGSLMWATIATRPDIAFAIVELSKFVLKSSRKYLIAAKRVIRYIKFTKDCHVRYWGKFGAVLLL